MRRDLLPQGAELVAEGVRYRVWARDVHSVEALVWTGDEPPRTVPLALDAGGYHHGVDHRGSRGICTSFA